MIRGSMRCTGAFGHDVSVTSLHRFLRMSSTRIIGLFAAGFLFAACGATATVRTHVALRAPAIATSHPVSCSQNNQIGMDGCGFNDVNTGDRLINKQVRFLFAHVLWNREMKLDFIRSEKKWMAWSSANCQVVADAYKGGSILPLEEANCMIDAEHSYSATLLTIYKDIFQGDAQLSSWPVK
jgi:uncharacterized protein YecT (DUF1311 family)